VGGVGGGHRRFAFEACEECAAVIQGRELEMFHDLPQQKKKPQYSHNTQPRCRADFPDFFCACNKTKKIPVLVQSLYTAPLQS
jgi:hypothetical protein